MRAHRAWDVWARASWLALAAAGALVLAAATGGIGCDGETMEHSPVTAPLAGRAPAPTAGLSASVVPLAAAPREATAAEIGPLLLARHASDLPSCEALARHGDAAPALEALGRDDPRLVVRARALMLLGECGDETARSALLAVAEDRSVHPKLRAASLEGLSRAPGARDETVRTVAKRLRADADPRVATAAARLSER